MQQPLPRGIGGKSVQQPLIKRVAAQPEARHLDSFMTSSAYRDHADF